MIKQNRQQVPSIPKPPPVPPARVDQSPIKEIIVGPGHNKILSISHGGMVVNAMTALAGMIATENANGYSILETVRINSGEMLVIFERK